ncbi:MAG: hypothetical protein Q9222_003287, partial [Ikaeria aurantiellina]
MSGNAAPIALHRFAEAIVELPLGNLHAKAAELRNSVAHLVSSNEQLQQFADDGDEDCAAAIRENGEVIQRMEMRIGLLRREVESRGFHWGENEIATANGKLEDSASQEQTYTTGEERSVSQAQESTSPMRIPGGTVGDEELLRRLRNQMDEDMNEDDD